MCQRREFAFPTHEDCKVLEVEIASVLSFDRVKHDGFRSAIVIEVTCDYLARLLVLPPRSRFAWLAMKLSIAAVSATWAADALVSATKANAVRTEKRRVGRCTVLLLFEFKRY